MPQDVTTLLQHAAAGDHEAADRLAPLVYDELRGLARRFMAREPRAGAHTLQTTALLHEAYMRLLGGNAVDWQSRAHFLAVAAKAMRQILADHARRRRALKRGGAGRDGAAEDWSRITLSEAVGSRSGSEVDVLAIDELLERLAGLDPRQHTIVEMRFFAGMTMEEIALVTDISLSTAEREWRAARAWLAAQLAEAPGAAS